jgi:hypothetical protein
VHAFADAANYSAPHGMNGRSESMRSVRPAPPVDDASRAPSDADDAGSQTQRLVAELSEVRIRMARHALQPTPTQRLVTPAKPKA